MASRQCTATAKGSGNRCRRRPIPGGTVCKMHGGGAPQVRRSARERLAALVEPALDALRRALEAGDTAATVRAALGILDRAGYPAKANVDVESIAATHAHEIVSLLRDTLKAVGIDPSDPEVRALVRDRLIAAQSGEKWKPRRVRLDEDEEEVAL